MQSQCIALPLSYNRHRFLIFKIIELTSPFAIPAIPLAQAVAGTVASSIPVKEFRPVLAAPNIGTIREPHYNYASYRPLSESMGTGIPKRD